MAMKRVDEVMREGSLAIFGGAALVVALTAAAANGEMETGVPVLERQALTQGGFAVVRAEPGATMSVGSVSTTADAEGFAFLGIDRNAPSRLVVSIRKSAHQLVLEIGARQWRQRIVSGLTKSTAPPPAAPPKTDGDKKVAALRSRADLQGFLEAFAYPIAINGKFPGFTGMFGDERVYKISGKPDRKSPHYGADIPAPVGTPIIAPATAKVVLADELNLEGKVVFLDHGQGLITMYLHLSRIDVKVGDYVAKGDVLGLVGMTGRTNGPHLCWRAKWRDKNLDPTCLTGQCAQAEPGARAGGAPENDFYDAGEIP
ncbi:MAG: M23 family metallopeptidase [Lysobacteraceae bacterium]|nr:MAG: M23 family metallopeptidase [Xanthomonadaceae bacterium]